MLGWGLERILTALLFDTQVQVVHAVCLGCTSLCARNASARKPLTPGFSSAPGEHNDGVCERLQHPRPCCYPSDPSQFSL